MKLCQGIKVSGNSTAVIKRLISQIHIFRSFVWCPTLTPRFSLGFRATQKIHVSVRLKASKSSWLFLLGLITKPRAVWEDSSQFFKTPGWTTAPQIQTGWYNLLSCGFFIKSFTFASPADIQIPTVTHKRLCHENHVSVSCVTAVRPLPGIKESGEDVKKLLDVTPGMAGCDR